MRPLVSRGLLLPTLVCTALILGPVGTAAAVVDAGRGASNHGVARAATWYGTDDTDTLTDRLDALDRSAHGSVLSPSWMPSPTSPPWTPPTSTRARRPPTRRP